MIKFTIRTIAKILTYILAALTCVAAYGGYVDPNIWATPQLLVLAYPYLALLTLIAGVVWLCMRRFIPAIVCGAALCAGGGAVLTNLPVATVKKAHPGEKTFSVMTFNIMHGKDARNRPATLNRTFEYILHSGADIVCVQELFSLDEVPALTGAMADSLKMAYPWQLLDPHTDLAMFSKYPAKKITHGNASSWMNIFDLYRVKIGNRNIDILNVHLAPYMLSNTERNVVTDIRGVRSAKNSLEEFKGSILSKMKESYRNRSVDARRIRQVIDSIDGPLIVCGDFNDVPGSWTYRQIRADDLSDAYTETGLGMMVTYNLHGFYFHIDQMLYRPRGLRALSVEKGKINSSDHFPQTATFALTPD